MDFEVLNFGTAIESTPSATKTRDLFGRSRNHGFSGFRGLGQGKSCQPLAYFIVLRMAKGEFTPDLEPVWSSSEDKWSLSQGLSPKVSQVTW